MDHTSLQTTARTVVSDKNQNNQNKNGLTSVRIMGVVILLIQLGLLFAYGFSGTIINEMGSWGGNNAFLILIAVETAFDADGTFFYITTMVFTLIGFACLYSSASRSLLSGFFISFFIVGYTTILSPLLQKFWYNVLIGGFYDTTINNSQNSGLSDYKHFMSTTQTMVSFYSMRISLLNAISQLVVFYGLYQRIHIGQIFLFSTIFQICWTLNFHLNSLIADVQPDTRKRLMDDYAISQVFLFGSVFALFSSIQIKKPSKNSLAFGKRLPGKSLINTKILDNDLPLIMSIIGTFLIFIAFMGITICFPAKYHFRERYGWSQGYMNILFALCSSVFTNMFITALTKNKLGLKEIQFGMIGGAIMSGPVAGTLDNIGAFMAIGTVAALVSAFYFGYLHQKLNSQRIKDSFGALYIAIVSFMGTLFVAPLVLIGMVRNEVKSNLLMNVPLTNSTVAGWSLIYVGISAGIAILSGLLVGVFMKWMQKQFSDEFIDDNIIVPLPGLTDRQFPKNKVRLQPLNHSLAKLTIPPKSQQKIMPSEQFSIVLKSDQKRQNYQ